MLIYFFEKNNRQKTIKTGALWLVYSRCNLWPGYVLGSCVTRITQAAPVAGDSRNTQSGSCKRLRQTPGIFTLYSCSLSPFLRWLRRDNILPLKKVRFTLL
jgi:hypothetical protein